MNLFLFCYIHTHILTNIYIPSKLAVLVNAVRYTSTITTTTTHHILCIPWKIWDEMICIDGEWGMETRVRARKAEMQKGREAEKQGLFFSVLCVLY